MSGSAEILVVGEDPVIPASLLPLAEELDATIRVARSVGEVAAATRAPLAVIADVAQEGAVGAAAAWRARWPQALLVGSIAIPKRDLWESATASGYDLVCNRGALRSRLRAKLAAWSGPPRGVRVRAVDVADVAGRLGVVARLEDTPAGPLAVYHVGGKLVAACDVCPHAGARLSTGALEEAVVTCPLHGSQFDVRTGERLRGPADDPIATYPVVVEDGVAYVELAAEGPRT